MKGVICLLVLLCITEVFSHSYQTLPITRSNQRQSTRGCRPPLCSGPCDTSKGNATRAPISIQRGAPIAIQWPRNNHPGGFIRIAWARFADSDSQAAFDLGAQQFSCHEVGCGPSDASDPNGGDTGPPDGSVNPCRTSVTVPLHLTDGTWTMQWLWFGGGMQLADYFGCTDYAVSGGATGPQLDPVFIGGDYTYPGQAKCKYFSANRPHVCNAEPCPGTNAQQLNGVPDGSIQVQATSGVDASTSSSSTTGQQQGGSGSGGSTTRSAGSSGSGSTTSTPGLITTSRVFIGNVNAPRPGWCPNPNAPNINADVLYPPMCGTNAPQARCPDGQCCSQYGYCGPIPDPDGYYRTVVQGQILVISYDEALNNYCTNNQGDWSFIPCEDACPVGSHLCSCTQNGGCDPGFKCHSDFLCHDPNSSSTITISLLLLLVLSIVAFLF